jgi:hypothetical protein
MSLFEESGITTYTIKTYKSSCKNWHLMSHINCIPLSQGFLNMGWQLRSTSVRIHKWGICLHQQSVQRNKSIFQYFTYPTVRFIFAKITCITEIIDIYQTLLKFHGESKK